MVAHAGVVISVAVAGWLALSLTVAVLFGRVARRGDQILETQLDMSRTHLATHEMPLGA